MDWTQCNGLDAMQWIGCNALHTMQWIGCNAIDATQWAQCNRYYSKEGLSQLILQCLDCNKMKVNSNTFV